MDDNDQIKLVFVVVAVILAIGITIGVYLTDEKPKTCEERGGRIEQQNCRKRFEVGREDRARGIQFSFVDRCDDVCVGAR